MRIRHNYQLNKENTAVSNGLIFVSPMGQISFSWNYLMHRKFRKIS